MTAIEVDHLFVFCSPLAPEADALVESGFAEGSPNTHAGQGTACRRFFFGNGMLEFLYVTDLDVIRHGTAEPTGLGDRWLGQDSGASPFGICFRPVAGDNEAAPFASWTYGPKYLADGTPSYEISQRCRIIEEPFAFFTPKFSRPDAYPADRAQPLTHHNGAREISAVYLESPYGVLPDVQSSRIPGNLKLYRNGRHRMQIEFDCARQGQILNLPTLPVTLLW